MDVPAPPHCDFGPRRVTYLRREKSKASYVGLVTRFRSFRIGNIIGH